MAAWGPACVPAPSAVGFGASGRRAVGVSVFVDHLIDGLGLSRSQVSAAYMVATLTGAAALPLVGRWIDRRGVRVSMTVIAVAFAVALAGMAGVAGFATLVVGFTGIRMLGQGSLTLVSTTSVAYWFDRRRGLALGVCTAAGTALMSLAPLVLAGGIAWLDWRVTWLVAAAVVLVVAAPIAWWGMRDNPAAVGQHVDGAVLDAAAAHRAVAAAWTRSEAARTLMFWAVAAAVAASGLVTTGLAFHQISLLGERGLSTGQAAANFLPQTAAGITAILATGWLADRLRPRLLLVAAMAGMATAMLLVQVAAPGMRAIAFGMLLGASSGSVRAMEAATFPRLFGTVHLGAIRGLVMTLSVAGAALGPWLLAVGHERFGGYGPVLNALLVLPAAVAVTALIAPTPTPGCASASAAGRRTATRRPRRDRRRGRGSTDGPWLLVEVGGVEPPSGCPDPESATSVGSGSISGCRAPEPSGSAALPHVRCPGEPVG